MEQESYLQNIEVHLASAHGQRTEDIRRRNRCELSSLIGTFTGHCLIGRHATRLGIIANDICRDCQQLEEEEKIEHLLCFCPAYINRRLRIFGR